jgi:competence protein ComEC
VLAISGQHVVILADVIYFAIRLFVISAGIQAGITMVLIWLYILITGASPLVIRAGVMATFVLAASPLGRQVSALPSMITMLFWVLHRHTAPWIAPSAEGPIEVHVPGTIITH